LTIRGRVILAALILVAEFAVLEAALRVQSGSEAAPAFQVLFMQDPRVGYRLRPDVTTTYATAEYSTHLHINAQGVRDDADIGPKAPDERRIVVLGDSLVLSVQVEFADTYCHLLEQKLNATDRGHRWRVINAGVQGYGPVDQWLFYRNVVETLQPDVVMVVAFVGNAAAAIEKEAWLDAGGPTEESTRATVTSGLRQVVKSSVVLQLARVRYDQLKARFTSAAREPALSTYLADPPPSVAHGLEVTRRAIGLIADRAAENHARTAVVLMPARFQVEDGDYGRLAAAITQAGGTLVRNAATDRYRTALEPLGLPTLDLLPALKRQPDPIGLFYQRNVHLTERGHRVVADALFQFLESNRLVTPEPAAR
jgi:hypothetical protein